MDSVSQLVGFSAEYCFNCIKGSPTPGYAVQKMERKGCVLSYLIFLKKMGMIPQTCNFSTGEAEGKF